MSDEPVVRATDVRKAYGDTVALDGVSLSLDAGEVFGLIGPNGAGKTTLVRALTGTTDVEGEVRAFGRPPAAADEALVGLLPQEFSPPARLTARELVDYYGGLYDDARPTDDVLADVGLADDADTWYEELSGGQKRRACVGLTLVNDPDVLFLDEPTTGIDPAGRRALWGLLDDLAASGTTVFLTCHSMDEVQRLSDRVGLLRDGALVAVGTPPELVAEYGGAARLVVGFGGEGATAAARTAAATLREAGFSVEEGADEAVVEGVTPADIGRAVAALDGTDAAYESLTWTEPTLEDVYLRLTGETFEGTYTPGASVVGAEADAGSGADAASEADAGSGADAASEADAGTDPTSEAGAGAGR
ncbi:ABC transporter ATP-binding protein [Candidatus Halobonum tyrrellensis]|uniref:Multidrug ABC transporter ATPase n=1 Tax=Candidatus Halobonum tyrrellensis G22 TaxID=1324957 RepID=V4HCQ8_9EURY|nr:ABC transporter ATP-binding protein [Candidatus Halobonum tyrrellensis]ESP88490.1 multidrug ABC transporter ATPase [Candidatus Halobonum tyrrellensis G22]